MFSSPQRIHLIGRAIRIQDPNYNVSFHQEKISKHPKQYYAHYYIFTCTSLGPLLVQIFSYNKSNRPKQKPPAIMHMTMKRKVTSKGLCNIMASGIFTTCKSISLRGTACKQVNLVAIIEKRTRKKKTYSQLTTLEDSIHK